MITVQSLFGQADECANGGFFQFSLHSFDILISSVVRLQLGLRSDGGTVYYCWVSRQTVLSGGFVVGLI